MYFILLALVPCGENTTDEDECCKTEMSQQANQDNNSDEACSPFCVGSCCSPHILVQDFQTNSTKIALVKTIYTYHSIPKLPEIALPIWQPPKLI